MTKNFLAFSSYLPPGPAQFYFVKEWEKMDTEIHAEVWYV